MKSVAGFIVAGLILLVLFLAANKNSAVPPDLGVKDGMMAPLPDSPNAVSSQSDQVDKRVEPFPYSGDLEQTKSLINK